VRGRHAPGRAMEVFRSSVSKLTTIFERFTMAPFERF
jgi:hypothetical protein